MSKIIGRVESVYLGGSEETLAKQQCDALDAQLDGLVLSLIHISEPTRPY